jgi:molybdenum cofactor sulfurtransferase
MDHAGATLYPVSIVHDHCDDLTSRLLSNPHSQSPSSIATEKRITAIRQRVLQAFNANAEFFDIVFVANATAGIKLVADGFAGSPEGFQYKYLRDVHTSLVGLGQLSAERQSLSEEEVKDWLKAGKASKQDIRPGLFAYPAQSNLNGRRFPLSWPAKLREAHPGWFCLLDGASYLTTTPLDFSNVPAAPDFTVLSFYKIFGYPDLGAVIVKRDAGHMLVQRKFFGGGSRGALTVDGFSIPRTTLHESLEDGTLPFHTILALEHAFNNFGRLFGAHIHVARHSSLVARLAHNLLASLKYPNGRPACKIYSTLGHGPIVAFNLYAENGSAIGFVGFEKVSSRRGFALRTGGMCNPGGVKKYCEISDSDMEHLFSIGKRCGDHIDIVGGRNIGAIRISFGACSTVEDVVAFVEFIKEVYMTKKKKLMQWTTLTSKLSAGMQLSKSANFHVRPKDQDLELEVSDAGRRLVIEAQC